MLHCSVRQKSTHSFNCVVPENIHTPPHGGQRNFRGEGGPKGDNFRGGVPSKID